MASKFGQHINSFVRSLIVIVVVVIIIVIVIVIVIVADLYLIDTQESSDWIASSSF